ncbi:iron-sulfur cluster carrier protein ApbC [Thalassotalea ganghwensis]
MFSKLFNGKKPPENEKKLIETFFNHYQSEIFPKGIASVCQLLAITFENNEFAIKLQIPFPCFSELNRFAQALLAAHNISTSVNPILACEKIVTHDISGVTNIIAVASGKGGVGKSTTAVNLAFALQEEGAAVGILDADIYGPSIPKMLGKAQQKPDSVDGKMLLPVESHGIESMSMGYLTDNDDATVWRGPMASRAFNQLLNETQWGELDYLIVDMPPGTGDIQLTLAQQVPVAGAVVVTTPQDIALIDAQKGIAMFNKVKVPVIGVIENMSYHVCQHCHEKSYLFGEGGGERIAKQFDVKLLGQLPLEMAICQSGEQGQSLLIENSAGDIGQQYRKIAENVVSTLYYQFDKRSPFSSEIMIKTID